MKARIEDFLLVTGEVEAGHVSIQFTKELSDCWVGPGIRLRVIGEINDSVRGMRGRWVGRHLAMVRCGCHGRFGGLSWDRRGHCGRFA